MISNKQIQNPNLKNKSCQTELYHPNESNSFYEKRYITYKNNYKVLKSENRNYEFKLRDFKSEILVLNKANEKLKLKNEIIKNRLEKYDFFSNNEEY